MNTRIVSLFLLGFLLVGTLPTWSQSVVGKWKRTGSVVTYKDGKTQDVQKMMEQSLPCAANITYEFQANGTLKTTIPADCQKRMSAMAKLFADTRYSTSGNKITVVSPDPKLSPTVAYNYQVQGNTMTMSMTFADMPTVPNPAKAKSMVLTYKRL